MKDLSKIFFFFLLSGFFLFCLMNILDFIRHKEDQERIYAEKKKIELRTLGDIYYQLEVYQKCTPAQWVDFVGIVKALTLSDSEIPVNYLHMVKKLRMEEKYDFIKKEERRTKKNRKNPKN